MLPDVAADIGGLQHGICQQININRQWEVVYSTMKLQKFVHADFLAHKKKVNIRCRFVITHGAGAKKDSFLHSRASRQHRRNHVALFLCQAIIHHLQVS